MRVLVSAASGLLGGALVRVLESRGDEVWRLDRRAAGARSLAWPKDEERLADLLPAGLEGVVHLAGSPLATWPWTSAARERIRSSRIGPTRLLAQALARRTEERGERPRLLCASAVGVYRCGWPAQAEDGARAESFLGDLCRDWEAAADLARGAGLSVAHLRTGLVLDPAGGLLGRLLPLWRRGLGLRLGPADLPWSWIHAEDWRRAVLFLLERPLDGPFNLCAPRPLRQDEALALLAQALGRRGAPPLPDWLVGLAGGRMARELLLQAPAAQPGRLLEAGFHFRFRELAPALADLLGVA